MKFYRGNFWDFSFIQDLKSQEIGWWKMKVCFFISFSCLFLSLVFLGRLKLHHRVSWIGLAFIFIESHRWCRRWHFYNLLSYNKISRRQFASRLDFFVTNAEMNFHGSFSNFLTRMMISGEFKSLPPASRKPQGSLEAWRCNVTTNSWYNWLIFKKSVTLSL